MSGVKTAPHWTEERIALMKRLRAQGMAASRIAAALSMTGHHFTRNAVIAKCDRLGLCKVSADRVRRTVRAAKPAQRIFPKTKAEPLPRPRAPLRGPSSVRFVERTPSQCPMFCQGEEGADGFVCGAWVERGDWCSSCYALTYTPNTAFARKIA